MDTYYTLGEGSFGVVYKGRSIQTGEEVAVKEMYKEDMDDTDGDMFETEVRLMRRLQHKNIVSFKDVFEV